MRKHGFLLTVTAAVLAISMCGCGNTSSVDSPADSGETEEQTSSNAPFLTVVPSSGSEIPEFPSKCGVFKQTAKTFTEEQLLSFFSEKPEREYYEVTNTTVYTAETEGGNTYGTNLTFHTDAGILCLEARYETYGEGIYTSDEELENVPRDKMLEDINKLMAQFGFSQEDWFISNCNSVKADLLDEFKDRTYKALTKDLEENPYSLDEYELNEIKLQAERTINRPSKDFYYIEIRFKINEIPIYPERMLFRGGVGNIVNSASCQICYSKDGIENISIGNVPITESSEEVEIIKYEEARKLISKKYGEIIFDGEYEVSDMKLVYIPIPQNDLGYYHRSFETRPFWAFRCKVTEERNGKPHTTDNITYFDAVTGEEFGTEQSGGTTYLGG